MVDAEVSGVMFTCNPVSGDPSMVTLNASWGLGLAVVGGEVTPDEYLVSKVTSEVVRERVHAKDVQYVPDVGGGGAVRVTFPTTGASSAPWTRPALEDWSTVARRIERYFGCSPGRRVGARPRRSGWSCSVVQTRPVTGMPQEVGQRPSRSRRCR